MLILPLEMSIRTSPMTAEQLAALPDDGKRYELVAGELRMMSPAGGRHGQVAFKLGWLLGNHVLPQHCGAIYAAETGFLLSREPDTVRAPDVAFVSNARLAGVDNTSGFLPLAPDLVGEVVSPGDSFSDVEEKAQGWLEAGTRVVLVVNPRHRSVHVYRARDAIVILDDRGQLDLSDVVPGCRIRVAEIFE